MTSKDLAHKEKAENFVRKDGVIKEQVAMETFTRNRYNDRWGFLIDFDKICLEMAKEEGIDEPAFRRMAAHCARGKKLPAVTDDWKIPSSGPMPKTTTGEIGWRSARNRCNLEFYGPLYKSPKETMRPLYEYTDVIFLG